MRLRSIKYISQNQNRPMDLIEMTMQPDFCDAVEKIRKKWSIDPRRLSEGSDAAQRELLSLMENEHLPDEIEAMLHKLGVAKGWTEIIQQYVLDGNIYPHYSKDPFITCNPDGLLLERSDDNPEEVVLRVGLDTTREDLMLAWREIERNRKKYVPRKRSRKNFFRDYRIYKLACEGKTIIEIHRVFLGEGIDIDLGNIKKILSAFCSRLKIPKKDRPQLLKEVTPKK